MKAHTKESQEKITPQDALYLLKEGNKRFIQNLKMHRDLLDHVYITSKGQYPFAVILSCIDSRASVELVFDKGIGDIFSVRVAGNIVNEDVLGSLEYSCKVAGAKLVVVMGHTKCGAVTAACNHVEMGNITPLLNKIKPAVDSIIGDSEVSDEAIEEVALKNVYQSIERIRKESPILLEMDQKDEIDIVAAMYDVSTGKVDFL